ncbi:hypothetical protein KKG83_05025 [Candidatus Micrarchaeota archaeon]|nr:hypothetical protein [Candidatus Micrarchaeota archaeon]MBU2476807.1 hypothetical protein [Candidatus Micrarchaeota archaeon]
MIFIARKPKIKKVHFEFDSHAFGQPYSRRKPKKKTKSIVVERAVGLNRQFNHSDFLSIEEGDVFDKSYNKYLSAALAQGKNVVAGENANKRQLAKLKDLSEREEKLFYEANALHTQEKIEEYFKAEAKYEKFRHRLIINTVKNSQKPLQGRYGTTHSLLTRELKEKGIDSSRDIKPQVFSWSSIVTRKLLLGKEPSSSEYKRAFISEKIPVKQILGKEASELTSKDFRFYMLVSTSLLRGLSEVQLDRVIHEGNYSLVFTLNGLPDPIKQKIPRKVLVDFLNKHSSFWKRQQNVAERKRKDKRRKARKN